MTLTSDSKVAVLGAGTMGIGIAYVVAAAGHPTFLNDTSPLALDSARSQLTALFATAVAKGKLDDRSAEQAIGNLRFVAEPDAAARGAGLVIEAVPENLALKQAVVRGVEPLIPGDAVIASNTSALSISAIASVMERPERLVGMHFFNPVPAMRLIEIVRGNATNDAVVEIARAFAIKLGKTAIVVKDSPGFATSRLGVVLGLEAMRMLEQGVASAADIDRAMELGYNHPVGPLRLTDMVGLDVRLAIAEYLFATFGDDTYKPPRILRELVARGDLGKKSGTGFFDWTD
jgi:3-hydroxybutyryl-CoA dehydrogenase